MKTDRMYHSKDSGDTHSRRVNWRSWIVIISVLIGVIFLVFFFNRINPFEPTSLSLLSSTGSYTTTTAPTDTIHVTSQPIQGILLDAPAHILLPDTDLIPAGLRVNIENLGTTNMDIVAQYPSATATAVWNDLQATGRLIGQYRDYISTDLCNIKTGIYELTVQAILHTTSIGALSALGMDQTYSSLRDIGSLAGVRYLDIDVKCTPVIPLRAVSVAFVRYNVCGYVDITAIPGSLSDNEMLSIAISLAKSMDGKILNNSR